MMDFRGGLALDLVDFEWICSSRFFFRFALDALRAPSCSPHFGHRAPSIFQDRSSWAAAAFRVAGFREPGLAHRPDTDGRPIVFVFVWRQLLGVSYWRLFFSPPC